MKTKGSLLIKLQVFSLLLLSTITIAISSFINTFYLKSVLIVIPIVILLLIIITFTSIEFICIILTNLSGRCSSILRRCIYYPIINFLPLLYFVGRIIGIHKRRIQASFVEMNNGLTKTVFNGRKPSKLLLLLPFCIQFNKCPHRIIWDVHNCKGCGQCQIAELIKVADESDIPIKIAIRAIFAPKIIKEVSPDLTITVACENELVKGVIRTFQYPSFGIINERPQGFCMNTQVNVEEVKKVITHFLM
ncbi:MAG: DUF116 domain-containing protein [bacterium]